MAQSAYNAPMDTWPLDTDVHDRRTLKLGAPLVRRAKALAALKGQSLRSYVEGILAPAVEADSAELMANCMGRQDAPAT